MSRPLKASLAALLVITVFSVFLRHGSAHALKVVKAAETQTSTQVQGPGDAAHAQLRELLLERQGVLEAIAKGIKRDLEAGVSNIAEYVDAKSASLAAGLDLCETNASRVKIYEEIVALHKESEAWTKRSFKHGRAGQTDLAKAKVARLDSEIDLLRERLK